MSSATVAIETFMTELSSVIRNWPAARVKSTSVAPLAPVFPVASTAGAPAAALGKSLLLQLFKLCVVDRAHVEQPLCLRDLLRAALAFVRRGSDLCVDLCLGSAVSLEIAARHAVVLRDDVD